MFAESNAIPLGAPSNSFPACSPTGTVAITELFAVLITETESSHTFVTYILLFAESNAMEVGPSPTDIVAITELFAVLITETESPS